MGPEAVGGGGGGDDEECGEGGGRAEVEGQAGDAGLEAEPEEESGGGGDEDGVPPGARCPRTAVAGAAGDGRDAEVGGEDECRIEAVASALAVERGSGGGVFALGGDGGGDGERAGDHDDGAGEDEEAVHGVGVGQLAEDERAPGESPELIGVGERDGAADAEVFGGVLLEDVADDPDEAAQKQPEQHGPDARRVEDGGGACGVECEGEEENGGEFADGEDGDEGERVHAAEIGLAVGDIHGSPEEAGAEGGEDAGGGTPGVRPAGVEGGEAEQHGGGDDGGGAENDFGDVARAGAFELAEEQAAPENADEGVGVPDGEGDGEADVADGEDGEGVGDGPQHAGEDGDGDEVAVAGEVGEDLARALEEGGERPAGEEDAGDHAEGDGVGREAGVDELGGGFSGAEPCSGGEGAEDAEVVRGVAGVLVRLRMGGGRQGGGFSAG